MPQQESILKALSQIIDPDLNQDIVSLGFIKNLEIEEGNVSFDIMLTTPACPVKTEFQQKAQELVGKVDGVKSVAVTMTSIPPKSATANQGGTSTLTHVGSVIAVSSCKGGVGKSTLAAYMALDLAQRGYKVGLADVDIHGPSVPTLFDFKEQTLRVNQENQIIPLEHHKLKIMSFGFLLGDAPAVMRGPMVANYVSQVLHRTAWGSLDYLFVDMPPGTGDVQLTVTQSVRLAGAVIVTTRQTLSLVDVARGILMFEKVDVPILGIVENMSYFICDKCDKKHYIFGGEKSSSLQERFGLEILAEVPLLGQLTSKITDPVQNEYIATAVDNCMRTLGKSQILKQDLPIVDFDAQKITFKWPNGEELRVNNKDLRLSCRCALCVDELTGEQKLKAESVREDIAPQKITLLGNYAIGVDWNDRHTSGIYPYKSIRKLAQSLAGKK